MTQIQIKKISIAALDQLQTLARQTFTESFAALNTEANMKVYLDNNLSREKLEEELANEHSEFYFAWYDDQVIGYLKLNHAPAQTDLHDEKSLEIERIYVLKAFQGQKIGQLLYEKALEIARQMHAEYVWLGVWEHNTGAIRFYQRNGFEVFHSHVFMLGDDVQTDLLMKLNLG